MTEFNVDRLVLHRFLLASYYLKRQSTIIYSKLNIMNVHLPKKTLIFAVKCFYNVLFDSRTSKYILLTFCLNLCLMFDARRCQGEATRFGSLSATFRFLHLIYDL